MNRNQYRHEFKSKNDDTQQFILTFEVNVGRRIHIVTDVKVYQRRGDMFCKVTKHDSNNRHSLHVESIHDSMRFGIDIYVRPEGCEIFVIENVLTTISHEQIAPC